MPQRHVINSLTEYRLIEKTFQHLSKEFPDFFLPLHEAGTSVP